MFIDKTNYPINAFLHIGDLFICECVDLDIQIARTDRNKIPKLELEHEHKSCI